MRRKIVYSSAFMILAGAGVAGVLWERPAAPRTAPAVAQVVEPPVAPTHGAPAAPRLPPAVATGNAVDKATMSRGSTSGEHFPDTPIGRALEQHMLTLVDISPGADERKLRSLAELRQHAKEASQDLIDAYHQADAADGFGRWLLSLTLGELQTDDGYPGLKEIAYAPIPDGLGDSDRDGNAAANESAIRQNAAEGLAALAHNGNAGAEQDLLALALRPPSGDDAVRTVAIKGYLAAGGDYAARVQALKAQLPPRYHDVVTLTVSQPEDATPPDFAPGRSRNGG